MVVLPLTCAQTAWGQGAIPGAQADSTETWTYRLFPFYTAKIDGDVTSMEMSGELSNTLELPNNLKLISSLRLNKEEFRLQPRSNEIKTLSNSVFKQFWPGFAASLVQTDSRMFNRVVKPGGSLQDLVVNTKSFGAGVGYATVEPSRFRWDARANADVSDSEKSFKRDKTVGGYAGGGVAYTLIENRLVVRARGFLNETSGTSESVQEKYDGMGISQDSVSAAVVLRVSDSLMVDFGYSDFNSEENLADQRRGSSGSQLVGVENVFREKKIIDSRTMAVNLKTRVLDGVDVIAKADHSEYATEYKETPTLNSLNISDHIGGSVGYTLFSGTGVTANFDNTQSLRDFGVNSPRSYDETRKQVRLAVRHSFSRTFIMELNASSNLTQTFFLRYEDNPRDRDQLEQTVGARISSTPFPKFNTMLIMSVSNSEVINIDATLSDRNRVTTKYDFRPAFGYNLNDRVTIKQNYGLAIEFTDMTFTPDENFLDRNITFSNEVAARLSNRLRGSFYYALHLHDQGSYLPEFEGGERYLNIDRKDRRDQTEIKVEYQLTNHFRVQGRHEYSRKKDTTVATGRERVTILGEIEGGVRGGFNWGENGELSFLLVKANRFSPLNTDERNNDFWIMNAQFKYNF